jgi:hypothetical protein
MIGTIVGLIVIGLTEINSSSLFRYERPDL